MLDLKVLKHELAIRSKNGIPFLLSATIVWMIITIIFLQDFEIFQKNVFMLYATGIMFPVAILVSKVIKADWKTNDHPLGSLGLSMNIAQFMYFPFIFWAFAKSPEQMVLFFAVITAAHFYLFGWLYDARAFYVMAPVMSVLMMIIGWSMNTLWIIPLCMVIFLLILIGWLWIDYKSKKRRIN